jgi:3-hydroxybutyryl-CoA dehydrogenase
VNRAEAGSAESDPRRSMLRRVFVAGAGLMGSGIAAQAALAGYAVTLEDVTEHLADRGRASALRALDHQVRRDRLASGDRDAAADRIETAIGLRRAEAADIVVEAAPEKLELKRALFRELEETAAPAALFATNTSSLPITSIASALRDPGRLVGVHFFNPVLQMPLVELIAGYRTRPEVLEDARAFAVSLGKTVVTSRDTPGFVTTRALAVLGNEAVWMLYEGVATREDIDTAHKLGFRHPMGPLELLDLVGLDTALAILDVLWEGFRDPKYRACPLLRTLVEAGKLGRKTGEGFYTYPPRADSANEASSKSAEPP